MSVPDDIRTRLLKVLRLAQEGVGGERENAAVLLEKLLRQHGMTMADLADAANPALTRQWLAAADAEEASVLAQVAISLFGSERRMWRQSGRFDVAIDVTPSEHAALVIAWDVYRAAFTQARQALVLGFCLKHGLFAPTGAGEPDLSPDAQMRARQALRMAETLPMVETPGRRIGGGHQD